ncbi:MAG: gamma-glutamylcyclotransferase [Desulfuromonadales bacterium]
MLYFAYAENMDIETLGERSMTFEKVGVGRARDFRLVFDKPASDGSGLADLMDDRGSAVEGVIWDVPESSLERLDVLAGVDKGHYRRIRVSVQTSRGEVDCVTYRAAKFRSGLKPSREYLDLIVRGAEAHRLSSDYLTFLRSHDTMRK